MGFIVLTIFLGILLGVAFIVLKRTRAKKERIKDSNQSYSENTVNGLKAVETVSSLSIIAVSVLLCLTFIVNSIYTVDSGEAIIFLQFGRVYDTDSTPGVGFMRPWASVIDWRTRLEPMNEQIECRDLKQMTVTLDITVWWAVDPTQLPDMYSRIAKDYEALKVGFVLPGIRSAVRDEIGKADFQDILENRDKYAKSITEYVAAQLKLKHVVIDKVNIRNVVPPAAVNEAIEAKIKAKQKEDEMSLQLAIAKKQADIRRAKARGIADAQAIIQQKLTPIYVQYEGIQMMKELADSPNTTFIFAPTSMNGIGLPAVHGGPIK